jgi:hypothetical protein
MCHVKGCFKEVTEIGLFSDDNDAPPCTYQCSFPHVFETIPEIQYRLDVDMKSAKDDSEKPTLKKVVQTLSFFSRSLVLFLSLRDSFSHFSHV